MLTSKFLAASVMALGLNGAATLAQDSVRADADTRFQQLDRRNKGYLTRADVSGEAALVERFAHYDANSDGKLDRGEFTALVVSLR